MHITMSQPWYTQWNWDPLALAAILVLIGIYLLGNHLVALEQLQQTGNSTPAQATQKTSIAFLLSIILFFITMISPLAILGHMLFAGHMFQHLLLSFGVAPLLTIALSAGIMQSFLRWRPLAAVWRWLTMPLIAALLFNGNLWIWHAPPLLDAMMSNPILHLLGQGLYVFTGLLFWWPLIGSPAPTIFPLNLAGKLIYILLSDMPMVLLGAGLTFMPPLYPIFQPMSQAMGISPATDQQLAGLIMWVPGGLFLIVIASGIFLQWMLSIEKGQKEEDARLAAEREDDFDEVNELVEHN
jgi:cytochrome c oxidase assembly factor CtaG